MCPVIRISDELYARLESNAVGFDTPSALIERLLDRCDGINQAESSESMTKPELIFNPSDEEKFKINLIKKQQAQVILYKQNGTFERRIWNASRLSESSNLRGNLWSGLLRGWKKKGIIKVELSIQED